MKSYWITIACLIFFSCVDKQQSKYWELIGKPAIPIEVKPGLNNVIVTDFIIEKELVDSISVFQNSGFRATLSGNGETIQINVDQSANRLNVLTFWSNGQHNDVLIKKTSKEAVSFVYRGDGDKIQIKGEMNAWNPSDSHFEKRDEDWIWTTHLNPGQYQYLYVIDGVESTDPTNQKKMDNGMGGTNSVIEIPRPSLSDLPLFRTSSFSKDDVVFNLSNDAREIFVFCENQLISKWEQIQAGKFLVHIPTWARQLKRTHLRVWASNEMGISQDVLVPLEYGIPVSDQNQLTRQDWHTSIMYFMMIDRFVNGNKANDRPTPDPDILPKANHYGGDLVGIDQKILDGYFSELGVNTIWLSPITQNPDSAYGLYPDPYTKFSGYHGYWPISNSKVDDRFGTKQDLDLLIEHAHSNEMNVILDYVANHVHEEHPLYKEHPDWATNLYLPDGTENTQKWDEHRLTTWFDTFMPTLDLGSPEVYQPMTDSALYWIKNAGFDGFRHDATKHIPEVFWRTLTHKIKKETGNSERSILQIGETYGSRELISSYISNGQLDAQFDFNLYDDAITTFARPEISMDRLVSSMKESFAYYGHHNLMGYITGNQDRPRFISLASGALQFDEDTKYAGWTRTIENENPIGFKMLSQLHALIMTMPGIPCIYYGDEFGSPGGNDPDNRRMMRFGDHLDEPEKEMLETAKKIIAMRNSHLALTYGDFDFVFSNDHSLVYQRSYFDDAVYVAFNKNPVEETVSFSAERELKAHFGSEIVQDNTEISLILAPHSFEILTLNN